MIEPQSFLLIGFPLAWTPGTDGPVRGEAILAPIAAEADFAKFKGKLKGKIVLTAAPKQIAPIAQAPAAKKSRVTSRRKRTEVPEFAK